jgi:hypothetical protein
MRTGWIFSPWFLVGMMVLTIALSVAVFLLTGWPFFFLFVPLPIFLWKRK